MRSPAEIIEEFKKTHEGAAAFDCRWLSHPAIVSKEANFHKDSASTIVMEDLGKMATFARASPERIEPAAAKKIGLLTGELADSMAQTFGDDEEDRKGMQREMGAMFAGAFYASWVSLHLHAKPEGRGTLTLEELNSWVGAQDLAALGPEDSAQSKRTKWALWEGSVFVQEWRMWMGAGAHLNEEFKRGAALMFWQQVMCCQLKDLERSAGHNRVPLRTAHPDEWEMICALTALQDMAGTGWNPVSWKSCVKHELPYGQDGMDRWRKGTALRNLAEKMVAGIEALEEAGSIRKHIQDSKEPAGPAPRI